MTNAHILYSEFGQSIWLNYFDRNLLVNGGFDGLILDGIRGANNNAEIFFNVFTSSNGYDETIRDFVEDDASIDGETLYQWLITKDTRVAADKLRAVYDSSKGDDGFVSVDIPAHVAYDTDKTLQTARHMWQRINRDNVMIKVPATKQGIAAITPLIAEGININVSCVYSLETYKAVVKAYLRGLGLNPDPSAVRSVASFGLSSFDAVVNDSLEEIGIAEVNVLKGKAAIAGARMAYQHYKQQLASDDFESQHRRGAKMQKLLWSDTRAHDPEYPELYYAEQLIGPDTVIELQTNSFELVILSENLRFTLESGLEEAQRIPHVMESLEIDFSVITAELLDDAVQKNENLQRRIVEAIENKRFKLAGEYA